jgi:alpha-D-ribose 1-methylphosphonate 5-triphosphate synthase subunit PhnG
MSVLATASLDDVEAAWRRVDGRATYRLLRAPETGLVMVRGRAGGTGMRFNLGEMTATRCTVELPGGEVGHGWVPGRNARHAELAAVLDALLQDPERRPALEARVLTPLLRLLEARRRLERERAASARVDFFTLVRGEE